MISSLFIRREGLMMLCKEKKIWLIRALIIKWKDWRSDCKGDGSFFEFYPTSIAIYRGYPSRESRRFFTGAGFSPSSTTGSSVIGAFQRLLVREQTSLLDSVGPHRSWYHIRIRDSFLFHTYTPRSHEKHRPFILAFFSFGTMKNNSTAIVCTIVRRILIC